MSDENLFYEVQKSPKWLLLVVLALLNGIFLFAVVSQIFDRIQTQEHSYVDLEIVISWLIVILASLFFRNIRLETVIRNRAVYVRFYPFQRSFRMFPLDVVGNFHIREVKIMSKRRTFKPFGRHLAFYMFGKYGVQLEFINGRSLFIGTKKPREIIEVLEQLMHNKNSNNLW